MVRGGVRLSDPDLVSSRIIIVTYGLGIYNLNLVIGFLPAGGPCDGGPTLPTKGNEEFKPFVRRLPEFKFWYRSVKSFCIAFFRQDVLLRV